MEVGALDSAEDSHFDGVGEFGLPGWDGEMNFIRRGYDGRRFSPSTKDDVFLSEFSDMPQDVLLKWRVHGVADDTRAGVLGEVNGAMEGKPWEVLTDGDSGFLQITAYNSG